jgi:hypothetical protein
VAAHETLVARRHAEAVARAEKRVGVEARRRDRWRGPDTRVNRINLMLLLSGFKDSPTYGERMIAAMRLERWGHDNEAIALRIDVPAKRIPQYRRRREEFRATRTQRRLADVRWKAARNALIAVRRAGPGGEGDPVSPNGRT